MNTILNNLNFDYSNKFSLHFLSNIIILLLPLLLITGPFLSDLGLVLVCIFFFIQSNFLEKKKYILNKFFLFFFIFWIYILLLGLFNNANFDTLKISSTYIRFGIFIIAFWYFLDKNSKILYYFFFSLLFCFWLLIIDGYIQVVTGYNILGMKALGPRVSSFFGEELILGSYLSRLFPVFFGISLLMIEKFKKKIIILSLSVTFILIEVLVFYSGERVAFFYVNLSGVFMIIFLRNYKKLRIITFIIAIIFITLMSFINQDAKKRIIDRTLDQSGITLSNTTNNNEKYVFSRQHTHHFLSAINMFKDNILFGVGIKNFRNFCSDKKYEISELSCSTHPHNNYLQLLSETGIIGFLFLILSFLYLCFKLIKHFFFSIKKKYVFSDFEICLLSAIFINMWPFIPTGNFFNNWLCIIYAMPMAILLWSLNKKKNNI